LFTILFAFQMSSLSLTVLIAFPCLAAALAMLALAVPLRVVGVVVPHAPPGAREKAGKG
jgi:hypothetical protein